MKKRLVSYPLFIRLCIGILLVIAAANCGRKKHDNDQSNPPTGISLTDNMDDSTKRWWLAKANRTLRLEQPLEEVASADELQKLAPRDIAIKLMSDKAFYDMMADFTGYWFGTKPSGIFASDNSSVSGKPYTGINGRIVKQFQIIHAVKAMASGEDYWANLFKVNGRIPFYDVDRPYLYAGSGPDENFKLSPNEVRSKLRGLLSVQWPEYIQLLKDGKRDEFCDAFIKNQMYYSFGGPFIPGEFGLTTMLSPFPFEFFVIEHCTSHSDLLVTDAKILEELTTKLSHLNTTVDELNRLNLEEKYRDSSPRAVSHVVDLEDLDVTSLGQAKEFSLYDQSLFSGIENSSTNRNRRRASWVLKRFFCDDLTPLNIEAPATHVGGQHGSDPACYSCHYKLDPMAGYFRELGNGGRSFANEAKITFDDGATAERSTYEQAWRAKADTGREWNIGYIRSVTDDNQNTFGSNFSDLLNLLRTAPEVKECFVRRAFEYVVGEEQAFDKEWARGVTKRMTDAADANQAIKLMFSELVLSKAYLAKERNNNVCYDLKDGVDPKKRAPCRIAALIERNCISCHSATNTQGGLDLSSWKVLGDGKPGFVHTRDGKEISAKETFQDIIDRINANDSSIRMPLMKTMPAQEREEIFNWLQKEVAKD